MSMSQVLAPEEENMGRHALLHQNVWVAHVATGCRLACPPSTQRATTRVVAVGSTALQIKCGQPAAMKRAHAHLDRFFVVDVSMHVEQIHRPAHSGSMRSAVVEDQLRHLQDVSPTALRHFVDKTMVVEVSAHMMMGVRASIHPPLAPMLR